MIKGLHHNAYRCRDSEETRKFYEDFLGLPLVNAFKIETTQTGRKTGTGVLHAVTADYRRGQLLGGEEGRTLVAEADGRMRALGVARPERWVRIYAPGAWRE